MKLMKKIVSLLFLLPPLANLANVIPLIIPRSQSVDAVRDLVGMTRYINLYNPDQCVYGAWAFTFEYEKTNKPLDIAECLFGNDLINDVEPFIKVSGSQSGDRNETDWLADYFGLPTDFESQLFFKPEAHSYIFDVAFYIGLDEWLEGLYFRCHAPVVGTHYNLNFTENIINEGVNGYVAGYFGPTAVSRSQLLNSFTAFGSEGLTPDLGPTILFAPLGKAIISREHHNTIRLSEIQVAFGWNFIQCYDHHFGLNIRGSAPTGTRPEGIYLFEPIVGNGHHWELGLGLTCHYDIFTDFCRDRYVAFYFDANLTHLFGTRQTRSFDLIGKPLSRYMLVQEMGTPVENLFVSNTPGTVSNIVPTAQFQNLLTPLANLTTFDVEVRVAAQIDAVAMIDIQWCNWNLDFGYNFWSKSCQRIKPCSIQAIPFDGNTDYALKGDAHIYGFVAADAVNLPPGINPNDPIALSATESRATIHAGTNTPIGTPFDPDQYQNPGIDLPPGQMPEQWAMVSTNDPSNQITILPGQNGTAQTQQRTSRFPLLITRKQIDYEAAESKGASNRIFAHISYNPDWCHCAWTPFIGVGGFAEFAHNNSLDCADPNNDNSCMSCAFSQWGVWIKGGVAY
ncbi:MAG: hypothetical protein AMXMBFR12_01060 [Candidatus Babeliales bacterium]